MDIDMIMGILEEKVGQGLMPLVAGMAVFLFLYIILVVWMAKLNGRYNRLMKNADGDSIEKLMLEYIGRIETLEGKNKSLEVKMSRLEIDIKDCIHKVGIIRYNAFQDTGSDLSFSLALLNDRDEGVVISSIFGRNESITYAKPIVNGQSEYALSKEEKEALKKAMS